MCKGKSFDVQTNQTYQILYLPSAPNQCMTIDYSENIILYLGCISSLMLSRT